MSWSITAIPGTTSLSFQSKTPFIYYFLVYVSNSIYFYYICGECLWVGMATFFSQIKHTYAPETEDSVKDDVDAATFLAATRESLALLGTF